MQDRILRNQFYMLDKSFPIQVYKFYLVRISALSPDFVFLEALLHIPAIDGVPVYFKIIMNV